MRNAIRGALMCAVSPFAVIALPYGKADAQVSIPEIVVHAPSPIGGARPSSESFSSVTTVTADELTRTPGATLGDVLANKPGIATSGFAPGSASRPIIRGLDNFRVRIQENGVGSHDVSELGEDHGVPIDPLSAERIEVIRGPATLRFGSQAIGGVVNADNNRIPTARPDGGFAARFKGAFTSVDRGVEAAAVLDAGAGNVAIHADAYGRAAGDYRIPGYPYLFPPDPAPVVNGRQPNSGQRANGQAMGGSYLFPGGFAGIAVSRAASFYHIPGFGSAASNTRIDLEQTKLTGKGEYRPDAAAVEAIRYWFGVTDYKHDEIGIGDDGVDGVQATFKNKEQEARIETQLAPVNTGIGPLATALGAQVGHQQLSAGGEAQELIAPSQTRSFAGYIFNELALSDTLKAQLAGRIERVKVEGTAAEFPADFLGASGAPVEFGATRVFTPKSASFGLLRTLPHGLVAGATAQYVERAPRALELFAKGAHDAPGTFEIGNSSLSIERARTVELSLRRPKGDWRFEATAYHTRFSGFIFKRLTGAMCGDGFDTCGNGDPANELTQVVYSQNDATFRGVELSTQLDVAPLGDGVFGIDGQFDVVRATFADGSNVPRIPPMRAGGGVFWRSAEWHARAGLLHAFAQKDISPGETTTDDYNLVKAELSYRHRLPPSAYGAREFVLGIVGDNLLNANVRNAVSFRKDQVLAPGRGIKLFAEVKY